MADEVVEKIKDELDLQEAKLLEENIPDESEKTPKGILTRIKNLIFGTVD